MIQSSLKETAIKIDFDGGHYEWRRRDKKVEKDVGTRAGVSSSAGRYLKNIFLDNDHILHSLRQVVQMAREKSNNMTLPWEPSRRLLLNTNFIPHQKMITEHRNAIDTILVNLEDSWDEMLQGAQASLGPLFNIDNYPTLEEVKQRTYIRATFYPISDASDVRLQADESVVKAIQDEVTANQQKLYADAIYGVWERLYNIIDNANENLGKTTWDGKQRGERFRTEWYDHIAELAPVLKGLNIAADPNLDEMAQRLGSFVGTFDEADIKHSATSQVEARQRMEKIHDDLSAIFGPMRKEKEDA